MSEHKKLTSVEDVKNSDLSEDLQKHMLNFILFLQITGSRFGRRCLERNYLGSCENLRAF